MNNKTLVLILKEEDEETGISKEIDVYTTESGWESPCITFELNDGTNKVLFRERVHINNKCIRSGVYVFYTNAIKDEYCFPTRFNDGFMRCFYYAVKKMNIQPINR